MKNPSCCGVWKTLTGWKRSICWYHFPHIVGIKNASIFEGSIQIKTCFMVQIHPWRLIWNIIPWSFGSDHFFLSISWLMAVGSSRYNLPGCKSVITWHISHTLSWCHFRAFIPRHAPWHQANPSLFACLLENVGRWEVAVVNHPNQHSFHSHLSLGSYKGGHVLGVSASRNATLSYVFWVHMGWGGVGLCSRSFNLHTLVMYTPGMLLLRYPWGGVGLCSRSFNLQLAHAGDVHARNVTATALMGWGGVGLCSRSFNLQLAHAGDVHARNVTATVSMGWGGVVFTFLQPSTCTRWWCTRQECYCYGTHGVG